MRKSAYIGILAMMLVMAALLMPTLATASPVSASAEGCTCLDSNGTLQVNLCAAGGQVHWDSFKVFQWNPSTLSWDLKDTVIVNEDIADGNCVTKYWGTGLTGLYTAEVTFTIGSNPSQARLLACNSCDPCPPIPEIATMSLLGLGILALGGFVYLRTRRAEAA